MFIVSGIANERLNQIAEAHMALHLTKNETSLEGESLHANFMTLNWSANTYTPICFKLDRPFIIWLMRRALSSGRMRQSCGRAKMGILASLTGIDETFSQPIIARHSYSMEDIVYNKRFKDIIIWHDKKVHIDLKGIQTDLHGESLCHDKNILPGLKGWRFFSFLSPVWPYLYPFFVWGFAKAVRLLAAFFDRFFLPFDHSFLLLWSFLPNFFLRICAIISCRLFGCDVLCVRGVFTWMMSFFFVIKIFGFLGIVFAALSLFQFFSTYRYSGGHVKGFLAHSSSFIPMDQLYLWHEVIQPMAVKFKSPETR